MSMNAARKRKKEKKTRVSELTKIAYYLMHLSLQQVEKNSLKLALKYKCNINLSVLLGENHCVMITRPSF